jgi:hypothetical protein
LDKLLNLFRSLPNGFYGLHQIILLLCFMALCQIKNPEQLKKYPCGELGKLLGLDRVPQVEYLRRKIHQITSQSKCDLAAETLFESWSTQMEETFYYIDDHVRVYNGSLAHLPKPLFTIVFDREAYEPQWFKKLWTEEHIAVISYRKNVKDKWDESLFPVTKIFVSHFRT